MICTEFARNIYIFEKILPIMQTVGDGVPDVPRRVFETESYIFAIINIYIQSIPGLLTLSTSSKKTFQLCKL